MKHKNETAQSSLSACLSSLFSLGDRISSLSSLGKRTPSQSSLGERSSSLSSLGERSETRGSTPLKSSLGEVVAKIQGAVKHPRNIYLFILTCCFSLIAFSANAEKTDIPCANNNGIIVKGNIEGEYCLGNVWVNYWNAVSWCDALGMQLADMTDCICTISTDCSNKKCPNFAGMFGTSGWWLNTPSSETQQWHLNTNSGYHLISWLRYHGAYPLCKNK